MSIKTKAFVLKFLAFSFWSISLGEGVVFSCLKSLVAISACIASTQSCFLLPSLLLHSIHSLNTDEKTKQGVYLLSKEKWLTGVGWKKKWKCSVTQIKCLKGGERLTWLTLLKVQSVQRPKPRCAKLGCSMGAVVLSLACQGCLTKACPPMKKHGKDEEKFPWLG